MSPPIKKDVTKLTKLIFKHLPDAKIGGKYIIHHLSKDYRACNQLEIQVPDLQQIGQLESYFREKNYLIQEKENSYYYNQINNKELKIKFQGEEYCLTFYEQNKFSEVHFHVNNLQIDKKGKISTRYHQENISEKDYINWSKGDIKTKRLSLVRPLSELPTSTERKYSYVKLTTLGNDLV